MLIIRYGIRARVVAVSNLFIKIVSFSGLIIATLVNARLIIFLFLIVYVHSDHRLFGIIFVVFIIPFPLIELSSAVS